MGQKSLQGMKFVTLIMLEQAHPEICIAFHGELKSWDGLKSHKLSATDEDAKVQVVVGLRWLDVFSEETLSHDRSPDLYNAALDL